MNALFVKQ